MADERRCSFDGPSESSPLLATDRPAPSTPGASHVHIPKVSSHKAILNLLLLVNLMASSAGGLINIPQVRLTEDVLCHEYYGRMSSLDVPIDEEMCKLEPIQSELAFILAVLSAFTAATGFVSAYPWSLLADRIGRRPVLSISLWGIMLGCVWTMLVLYFPSVFPVRLLWLQAIGQFIGGGVPTAIGLLLSMLADETTEKERAVVFLRQHMVSLCGNLVAPTVSSTMMARFGPWPPYLVGTGLLAASAIVALFVPETLQVKNTSCASDGQMDNDDPSAQEPSLWRRLKTSISLLAHPSLIFLLLTCLATLPVAYSTSSFLPLFISKRYGAKLFEGGYVQTAYGIASMVQSLLFLPWLCRYLMRPSTSPKIRPADEQHRDLAIARWSAAVTILATLVMGLAPNLVGFIIGLALLALGSGLTSLVRSLMSCYVDPVHRSRLFGTVGMVEILGAVYADPMLAGLFSLGMKLGGAWIGFPYDGLSVLVTLVTGLLLFVRLPKRMGVPLASTGETSEEE